MNYLTAPTANVLNAGEMLFSYDPIRRLSGKQSEDIPLGKMHMHAITVPQGAAVSGRCISPIRMSGLCLTETLRLK